MIVLAHKPEPQNLEPVYLKTQNNETLNPTTCIRGHHITGIEIHDTVAILRTWDHNIILQFVTNMGRKYDTTAIFGIWDQNMISRLYEEYRTIISSFFDPFGLSFGRSRPGPAQGALRTAQAALREEGPRGAEAFVAEARLQKGSFGGDVGP